MRTADFDYELPEDRIAQRPVEPRDASRLMLLDRAAGEINHHIFRDLPQFLRPPDLLVVNDSRVMPARLHGTRIPSGGRVEMLLLHRRSVDTWEVLVRPGRRLQPGARVQFGEGALIAEVVAHTEAGGRIVRFTWEGVFESILERLGEMPLPPYIKERLEESERYQTVYAREEGSAAAPTAGLHFTDELLDRVRGRGVRVATVTLHVGLGTFRPMTTERIEEHQMHAEYYRIPLETVSAVQEARQSGGRVIAVGTTVVRVLESVVRAHGSLCACDGWTEIFIYPGYSFRCVDALVTNFHLPRSTLLMLVSAFAGRERTLAAYEEAIREGYRFFSFGDAMLIV